MKHLQTFVEICASMAYNIGRMREEGRAFGTLETQKVGQSNNERKNNLKGESDVKKARAKTPKRGAFPRKTTALFLTYKE